jgi:hypothetical protein
LAEESDRARRVESTLRENLTARTMNDPTFWDFADSPARSGSHALFQYPAMMVPELQGALLDDLRRDENDATLIYDPFMGSGTVMLESLYRGFDFHGSDINPMAVLLATVKSAPPSGAVASAAVREVTNKAARGRSARALDFPNRSKWFKEETAIELTRLRRAIQGIDDLAIRRFLWVCLAETVRLVSNSRTSTFKLHAYAPDVLAVRTPDAVRTFASVGAANSEHVAQHWRTVATNRALRQPRRPPIVTLLRGDVSEKWSAPRLADVLMTSPPYGDNRTTVPYGQHSYLPLRWIDHGDLVGTFDIDLLSSTARIDSLSLGGSIVGAEEARKSLLEAAPSLAPFFYSIEEKPILDKKVLAFARDYAAALTTSSSRLRDGGISFWTLGERRVNREIMPLVALTREKLESLGHSHVTTITRRLPLGRKRMAGRNSQGSTMATEYILVMKKGSSSEF